MNGIFRIIIADPNSNIRMFLKRELSADGYDVQVASKDHELFSQLNADLPPDLIILEMNLPFDGGLRVLERLSERVPPVPVIVHSEKAGFPVNPLSNFAEAIVEKSGDPDALKKSIRAALRRNYPDRFDMSRVSRTANGRER